MRNKINNFVNISLLVSCLLLGSYFLSRPAYHWSREALFRIRSRYTWANWKKDPSKTAGELGSPVAWLNIKGNKINTMVVLGESKENLLKFPVLSLNGSDFRKGKGTKVIMAHRDIHFRDLKDVSIGQVIEIELADSSKRLYKVKKIEIVEKVDLNYHLQLNNEEDRLILLTCYPFYYIGHAPKRYIVRADRIFLVDK